jgi:type III secretion protein V
MGLPQASVIGAAFDGIDPARLQAILSRVVTEGIAVAPQPMLAELLLECAADPVDVAAETFISRLSAATMDLMVPADMAAALDEPREGGSLLEFLVEGLWEENGLALPTIRLQPADGLPDGTFALRINDLTSLPVRTIDDDHILVNDTPERLGPAGYPGAPMLNPATMQPGALVEAALRERLEAAGYTTWDRPGHVVLAVAQEIRDRVGAVVHTGRLQAHLDTLEASFPDLVRAARARVKPHVLAMTVRRLAYDHVPLRDMRLILERLIDLEYAGDRNTVLGEPVLHGAPVVDRESPESVEAFVRAGMRGALAQALLGGTDRIADTLTVYLVGPSVEALLAAPRTRAQDDAIIAAVSDELAMLSATAQTPAVLTADALRLPLRRLLRAPLPRIRVVCYGDLPPDLNIQPIARIDLPDTTQPVAEDAEEGR